MVTKTQCSEEPYTQTNRRLKKKTTLQEQLFQRRQRLIESGHFVDVVPEVHSTTFGAAIAAFVPLQDTILTPD